MKPSQKQVVLVWQSLSLTTSNHKKDLALNFQLSQNIHVEDETRANSENQCNLMKKNADGRCAEDQRQKKVMQQEKSHNMK